MATIAATITNLSNREPESLAFSLAVTGDAGGQATATMMVYDAAGTERERTDLGTMAVDESWDANLDLPGSTLGDGDYGAWVYVGTTAADGQPGPVAQEGVSFLVGRGQIYPSQEHADKRQFTTPPTLSRMRLEGSWVVFDMTNNDTSDLEVYHQFAVGAAESNDHQMFERSRAASARRRHAARPLLAAGWSCRRSLRRDRHGPERRQRLRGTRSDGVSRSDGNVFTMTSATP